MSIPTPHNEAKEGEIAKNRPDAGRSAESENLLPRLIWRMWFVLIKCEICWALPAITRERGFP